MARRNKSSANLSSLIDRVRANLPNFLLGLTILVVFALLSTLYLQGGKKLPSAQPEATQPTKPAEQKETEKKKTSLWEMIVGKKEEKPTQPEQKKHTVVEGDSLWTIAETHYGSGYNAYDIAQANKLENPDVVEVGMVLAIPDVAVKDPTKGDIVAMMTEKITIAGSEYVVKEGDSLWTIAQGAYGDGYAWTRIAQANNLSTPDFISAGQKLSLPR